MKKSTLLHLRIPFSFFLMPMFCFAVSVSQNVNIANTLLAFFALHLFVYPASNGFNSYYDRDEGSIGGLENPPKVEPELLFFSLLFDVIGLIMALFVSLEFALDLLLYGLVSKAYSHSKIRLKKYPVAGLLSVAIFQGGFIFSAVYMAVNEMLTEAFYVDNQAKLAASLSSFLLLASYPMTQVYQHEEDAKRGDLTLSRILGIRGTFIYTAIIFALATAGFAYYFQTYHQFRDMILFQVCLLPVLLFFLYWFRLVFIDEKNANFKNTMRLNMLSSVCLNVFFVILFVLKQMNL
ncbi:MAG: ubiquinone biosynthesis protein UbiA [Bacteroidetes bacterium]|nr:MAG: ubiquinone biosynthesis protein UbiA [Bacteroidota bacterium]